MSTPARHTSRWEGCPTAFESEEATDPAVCKSSDKNSQQGRRSTHLQGRIRRHHGRPSSREGENRRAKYNASPVKRRRGLRRCQPSPTPPRPAGKETTTRAAELPISPATTAGQERQQSFRSTRPKEAPTTPVPPVGADGDWGLY
jgi:hypothetical protein